MSGTPKILIVDDKVGNLVALERILADLHVELVRALSGNEALAKTLEHEFAIILMDVQMPDMDGFETVKLLRMDPQNRNILVIYISAVYSGNTSLILGVKTGAVDFIIKPIVPEILIGKVKIFLELHENRMALQEARVVLETRVRERTEELEQSNRLLKASEEKLSSFMDAATAGFTLLDSQLNIVEINIGAWKSLAKKKLDVVGKNLLEFNPDIKESGRFYEYMEVMRSGKPFFTDEYVKDPRFGEKYTSIKAFKVGTGLGIITTDITERKQAEKKLEIYRGQLEERVEERTKELESFSYSVSHDLRAPLRHIDGFVKLLLRRESGHLDSTSAHYLETITKSSKRMGQLIDDLLAFSRTNRIETHFQRVDSNDLIREIRQELSPLMEGRRIVWKVGDLPVVEADRGLLLLVWENLLSNAIKFTEPRDEACIEIGAMLDEGGEGAGGVTFFVRDNGVGFDPQYKDKLFGDFQRLHSDDEFEGTGIGMAIVRRIVQRHGGWVSAEGEVDRGATFYFSLKEATGGGEGTHESKEDSIGGR